MILALLGLLAFADPPACPQDALAELPTPEDRLAVAWVAPWRRRPHGRVAVVPTVELRDWLKDQDPWWTGRTLQWLGVRRRNRDPSRRYQVRVMEVHKEDLCRPIRGMEKGTDVAGIGACGVRDLGPSRSTDGCGRTLDRRTGKPGATRYAIDLSRVSSRGYCVVPLDRYIEEVTGK